MYEKTNMQKEVQLCICSLKHYVIESNKKKFENDNIKDNIAEAKKKYDA